MHTGKHLGYESIFSCCLERSRTNLVYVFSFIFVLNVSGFVPQMLYVMYTYVPWYLTSTQLRDYKGLLKYHVHQYAIHVLVMRLLFVSPCKTPKLVWRAMAV